MSSDTFGGTIPCFLCKAFIYYDSEEATELSGHMTREHNVFFGLDFLLAACVMNEDERVAIVNVVKDRQPKKRNMAEQTVLPPPSKSAKSGTKVDDDEITIDDFGLDDDLPMSALTPETTLQEEQEVEEVKAVKEDLSVSPPSQKDAKADVYYHHCTECGQSFKLKIQLNRHVRMHDKEREDKENEPPAKKPKENKEVNQEEVMNKMKQRYQLMQERDNLPDRPPSQQRLSRGGPKANNSGNGSGETVAPGTDAGPGNSCPICTKEFKSNGPMRRHFEDIHMPGEFPCPGCQRIFTSKNKVSSHYSRNCKRRETIG